MSKTQKTWLTPLVIPEGKIGEYEIQHMTIPAGEKVMLNSFRNRILGGQKGVHHLIYDVPTQWHKLVGPTGTLMTDLPVEQRQMEQCLKGMKGRVLVGGLGLGLAATILAKRKQVKEVVVVEISPEVIELVYKSIQNRQVFGTKIIVLNSDLFTYLKEYNGETFDYAFFDIWQSDSEGTFFDTVVPLIQLSKGKVKHPPVSWNEDVMHGQLLRGLQGRFMFTKPEVQEKLMTEAVKTYYNQNPPWQTTGSIWHDWAVPFFQWWKERRPDDEAAQLGIQLYCSLYGTWDWEDKWQRFTNPNEGL